MAAQPPLQREAARAPEKAAHVARRERALRAAEALEHVGLLDLAEHPARMLSGGEQQRLALARAWALRPDVLFLDEPTANLDPSATKEVEAIITAIHAAGAKIVMSTHNLGQARRLGDDVLFLHQGRLVERAPLDTFSGPRRMRPSRGRRRRPSSRASAPRSRTPT